MSADKKINWGGSLLIVVLTDFFLFFLDGMGATNLEVIGWWVGPVIGCVLAAIFICLRPRYEQAGRFWKPVYRFLLEQMSPPS